MSEPLRFSGIMPANILPFRADLSIDEAAYRSHLRWLADTPGVTGIVANGHAAEVSSLSREERKRALAIALDEVADACPIVAGVYSDGTQEAVELACERGMDILSEKPIADTLAGCAAIVRAVNTAGVKMMVTQNYRYTRRILTLKEAVSSLGAVNYVVARYASDYRERGAWAMFRHELDHSLLVEGGIHHLDQIRNLSGADCQSIAGWDWNPGQTRGGTAAWRGSGSRSRTSTRL